MIVLPYESQVMSAEYAALRLKEHKVLQDAEDISIVCAENLTAEEREGFAEKTLSGNDIVVAVSTLYNAGELDPSTEEGWCGALYDSLIRQAHKDGKKVVILSAQLPYDAARYPDADAILCCYNAKGMTALPGDFSGDTLQYGPNIPAAIYAIFGGCDITGRVPVNIPELDPKYVYSQRILYERGEGILITP